MVNVCAWMPIYGRHDILKISLAGFANMQARWKAEGVNLFLFVAWSELEDLHFVLKNYGLPGGVVFAPNTPLSTKHNTLMREALNNTGADFFLQIGSDDVFLPKGDELYFEAIDSGAHNVGCDSIYFMHPESESAVMWKYGKTDANKLFGAGRLFSREAVELAFLDGVLWDKKANRSLDFISENRLIDLGFPPCKFGEEAPYIIDIKSGVNIWGFERYRNGEAVNYAELKNRLREVVTLEA
jgi:hypothetical protein